MRSRSVSNIIINTHREWIWFLEYHSDSFSQDIYVHSFKNILSVQKDFAVNPASFYQIIHTVDRLEKCGFTTTTRSDKRGDLIWLDLKVNVFQCLEIAII